MTYNFLTVQPLGLGTVTAALAQCLSVHAHEVDVADETADQDLRNWHALVLCETARVRGDVATSLDIYVQDSVRPQPAERELASAFARAARTVVLFPTEEVRPSAYWLAAEDGLVTRTRLYESDDEEPRYTIDSVDAPVSGLPHVTIARIPEVARELKVATPLADAFAAHMHRLHPEETSTPGTAIWRARSYLGAWEKLVRQLEGSWAPSDWYPLDLYRERLEARDQLERGRAQLPYHHTVLLRNALEPLDSLFADLTIEDAGSLRKDLAGPEDTDSAHGWWWNRRPDPLPW
ncbi:hypothetical protein [Streptomyces sp. NPDC057257]|uniref:hypothetical protein n=1 Tax=Streptomyces sp. NPDC057257 TaxID=3346071 RepID=UPI003630ECEC